MTSTSLTTQERMEIIPRLKLKTDANVLNEFIKNTHREFRRKHIVEPRRLEKNKKLEAKKAQDRFKKEFNKLIEVKHHKSVMQKDNAERCTTIQLARILDYLIENKEQEKSISDIHDFTYLLNKVINKGLKFLVRYNIIKEINKKGRYFYVYP